MAEKIKDWTSVLIWAIGLIFVGGMAYSNMSELNNKTVVNANDIRRVDKKADDNKEAIHREQLARTEMMGKVNGIAEDTKDVKEDIKDLKEYLMDYDFGPKKGS